MGAAMIVYTVYESGKPAQDLEKRAENLVFIKEGFTWWGFLFGPLWLLLTQLWLEFIFALVLAAGIGVGLAQLGFREQAPGLVNLLLMLLIGFEGNDLRRWRLERKGYVYVASVAGRNMEECEHRFLDAWLPSVAGGTAKGPTRPTMDVPPSSPSWPGTGVVGTLPGAMA